MNMYASNAAFRHVSQAGAALLELVLILIVLLLLTAGIVEFGRALWYYDALSKGTRDAARFMSVVPASDLRDQRDEAQSIVVAAGVDARVPGLSAGNVTVVCDAPTPADCSVAGASEVGTITVRVSYPMVLGAWIPFVPAGTGSAGGAITLSPFTTMRYMW